MKILEIMNANIVVKHLLKSKLGVFFVDFFEKRMVHNHLLVFSLHQESALDHFFLNDHNRLEQLF